MTPSRLVSPIVDRIPKSARWDEGPRIEFPVSVPRPTAPKLAATAAAVDPDEPLSIPDQINPIIQKHLAADPATAGHAAKLEQDLQGNLSVICDGKVYERPDMIEDLAVRKAIRAALSEWDRI